MEQTFLAVINWSSLLDKEIKVNFVSRGMNDFLKLTFFCAKRVKAYIEIWTLGGISTTLRFSIGCWEFIIFVKQVFIQNVHDEPNHVSKINICCIFYLYICCYVVGVLVGLHADGNNFHNLHGNLHQVLCRPHSVLQSQEASSSPVLRDPSQTNYHSAENGLYPLTVL